MGRVPGPWTGHGCCSRVASARGTGFRRDRDGEGGSASVAGAVGIARAVEEAGYRRYWVSEHHNMRSLACSAPELLTAHIGAHTSRLRVGAGGHHAAQPRAAQVAESFRTLLAMYPGRIDLALGRAPGTDPLTAHVLRREWSTDPAAEFPGPGRQSCWRSSATVSRWPPLRAAGRRARGAGPAGAVRLGSSS